MKESFVLLRNFERKHRRSLCHLLVSLSQLTRDFLVQLDCSLNQLGVVKTDAVLFALGVYEGGLLRRGEVGSVVSVEVQDIGFEARLQFFADQVGDFGVVSNKAFLNAALFCELCVQFCGVSLS